MTIEPLSRNQTRTATPRAPSGRRRACPPAARAARRSARGEEGGRDLRLHAPGDRRAARAAGGQARRRPEGARGVAVRVWFLDNGSIVIEHTQLQWNVPGPQVRIPVYSVLVEHDDGLFLLDTGIDL